MSYARMNDKDSDVYVILAITGMFDCINCRLHPPGMVFMSTDAMIEHLREHLAEGHRVPERTIPRLEAEREENDAFIRGMQTK